MLDESERFVTCLIIL